MGIYTSKCSDVVKKFKLEGVGEKENEVGYKN